MNIYVKISYKIIAEYENWLTVAVFMNGECIDIIGCLEEE